MKRKKEIAPQHICDDCAYSQWFTAQWNLDLAEQKPITMHCHIDPANIKRGIFRGTPACNHFKQR